MALPSLKDAANLVLMEPQQVETTDASVMNLKRALRGQSAVFEGSTDEPLWDKGGESSPDPEALMESLARDQQLLKQHDPRPLHAMLSPHEKHQLVTRI